MSDIDAPTSANTMDLDIEADTRTSVEYIWYDKPHYACSKCCAILALQDELISKAFSGREGKGYLMHSAINVKHGKKEERHLLTGVHIVADLFCVGCNTRMGWYYVKASDSSQKYKEGKYLLEKEKIYKNNMWKPDD